MNTTAPTIDTVLYDGHCRFCSKAARELRSWTDGKVDLLSFREPDVLPKFPGITEAACNKAMHFIAAETGQVFTGAEALVMATRRRWFGQLARVYYAPGVRQLSDAIYSAVAKHRFKIAGRECADGTCHLHLS